MKKMASVLASIVAVLLLSSCATIMKGSQQQIKVNSTPSKAQVSVKALGGEGVFEGVTPAVFKVSKSKEYNVVIKLDGYKEQTVYVRQGDIEGAFWGNICIGGIIGIAIDIGTGSWKKLEPNTINVTMATASLENKKEELYAVFNALDDNGDLRSIYVPMIRE